MLYRVAQIQLSMLSPLFSNWTLPHTPNASHTRRQTDSLRLCWTRRHTDVHTQTPTQTSASSHPTNSAVLSVPAWTAFTFAVLASAMFVAARVTRPLVTPSAHPAVFTAAAARHTNAMATTVRCTNLCGRQGHRKRRKKRVGEDRQTGRKGGWRWKGKTRRWLDKATRVKKRQIQELLSRKGGHAPLPCLMAAEKKFLHLIRSNPFWQYKSNKSITKKGHGLWQP